MKTDHAFCLPAFLVMCAFLCGCETISQDFTDLSDSLSTPSPLQAAEMMFDKYNADNRRRGTVLLSNSDFGGGPVYVEAYRQMVADERNPLVLAVAIRALAKHGEPNDAPPIAVHLTHENRQVRWEAAKGLQRLHNPEVVAPLLETARNEAEEADVRLAAVTALAQYPEDRVFQGLVAALSARELSINVSARQALHMLTGAQIDTGPADWLAWYDDQLAAGQDPFTAAGQYMYPTYARSRAWWEQLAFWVHPIREQPGLPAGLQPEDTRSTWDDEDGSSDESNQVGQEDAAPTSDSNA